MFCCSLFLVFFFKQPPKTSGDCSGQIPWSTSQIDRCSCNNVPGTPGRQGPKGGNGGNAGRPGMVNRDVMLRGGGGTPHFK